MLKLGTSQGDLVWRNHHRDGKAHLPGFPPEVQLKTTYDIRRRSRQIQGVWGPRANMAASVGTKEVVAEKGPKFP